MHVCQYRVVLLSACLPIAVAMSGCVQPTPVAEAPAGTDAVAATAPAQSPAERGRVLVTVGGCHDCHTPKIMGPSGPEPDMSRSLSGHQENVPITAGFATPAGSPYIIHTIADLTAWSGPWGVSFAANLTPDPDTGMRMPERMFLSAMKAGAHLGTSRPILPPMPWQMYAQLDEEDLRAIFAYLRTLTPIRNQVPEPIPPSAG
jgi:mono/diheme cytochrome c family protein